MSKIPVADGSAINKAVPSVIPVRFISLIILVTAGLYLRVMTLLKQEFFQWSPSFHFSCDWSWRHFPCLVI
jgi:hypothetical protein